MDIKFILIYISLIFSISDLSLNAQTYAMVDGEKVGYTHSYFNPKLKKPASVTNDYIGFYQKFISGTRSTGCPMYPSCSNYGLKVFNERSLVAGFVLTSDRLMRCGHEHSYYKPTLQNNGIRLIDYPAYDPAPEYLEYKKEHKEFCYADAEPDNDDVKLIKKLINHSYYSEALIEIFRFELSHSDFNKEVFINKIICLIALDKQEDAIYEYGINCPESMKSDPIIQFYISKSFYALKNWKQTIEHSEIGTQNTTNPILSARLLSLKAIAQVQDGQLNEGISTYNILKQDTLFTTRVENSISFIQTYQDFKPKSPKLAGYLSIIPGLGYTYAGHKQTGISALILNGLLFYATYSNIKRENYGMAALTRNL